MAANSDTLYPSQKAVKTYADGKAPSAAGVLIGGTTNQVLTKNSSTDLDLKWATPSGGGGGVMTLLKANSGTDATPSATNVDTVAITGLTAKDTLLIILDLESVIHDTATPVLYSSTDSVVLGFSW